MMPMMPWFGGFSGLLTGLVLIVLAVAACAVVVNSVAQRDRRTDDSEELLRMRYAAGEIDTEEYRKRLTALHTASGAQR
jgi:uncharacterized membrane protein